MTTAWWLLGPHCSQTTHVTFPRRHRVLPPAVAVAAGLRMSSLPGRLDNLGAAAALSTCQNVLEGRHARGKG
jgi:hypothetical protein